MFDWIAENIGTLLVSVILAAAIVLTVIKLIKNKKSGKTSCGYSCSHCPLSGSCRKPK